MTNKNVRDAMLLSVNLLVKESVESMLLFKHSGTSYSTELDSALEKLSEKELTRIIYHFLDLYYDNLSQLSSAIEDQDS